MADGSIPFELTQDDFDGLVEGDDGEFYFEQKRPKKRQSKYQQMLGIFADEDDESSVKRQKVTKGVKFVGASDKPVSFVSAGSKESSVLSNTVEEGVEDAESDAESDSEVGKRFHFKGDGVISGPKLESKVDMSESQMAQKYGVGFKLLQKQGWKGGGLGSNEDGIANPIQVAVRGRNMGLRQDDVSANLNSNLHGFQQPKYKTAIEMLLGDSQTSQAKKVNKERKQLAEGWKKGAQALPRPKRDEHVEKVAREVPKTYIIRDMTGPQERVITVDALGFGTRNIELGHLQELKFNMSTLAQQSEAELQTLQRDLSNHTDMVSSLQEEIAHGVPASDVPSDDFARVLDGMRTCTKFISSVRTCKNLRQSFPLAFENETVHAACSSVMAPIARKEVEALPGILASHDEVLKILLSAHDALGPSNSSWSSFVRHILVDKLRQELSAWDVRDVCAVDFFERMSASPVPKSVFSEVLEQYVAPQLETAVKTWAVSEEADGHVWILPWIVHMPLDRLQGVFEIACQRLCMWLASWDFTPPSTLMDRLRPWKQVFRETEWFMILRRLKRRLMEMPAVKIRRDNCIGELPLAMFHWAECLRVDMQEVLEAKVFKPWLDALQEWLEDDCDYKVVLTWLKTWRSSIPKNLLETPYVDGIFAYAFQVMKHFMTDGKEPMPSRHESSASRRRTPPRIPRAKVEMSIKEVLEEIAGEEDLRMVPLKHMSSTNKQLYTFGKAVIFWENDVVYCQKNNKFEPLPLDALLKVAIQNAR